jgi:hypothetical protein
VSPQVAWQAPPEQAVPLGQACPQAPQLALSTVSDVQPVGQHVSLAGHAGLQVRQVEGTKQPVSSTAAL